MLDALQSLFTSDGFMPHGMSYLWQPGILTPHVVSDAFIALAYASIPLALLYFVRRRRDLQFNWMFVCFAIFIIACGTTHVMEIVTIWNPHINAHGKDMIPSLCTTHFPFGGKPGLSSTTSLPPATINPTANNNEPFDGKYVSAARR